MSSPTFLGGRPSGPSLGARAAEDAISPPTVRSWRYFTSDAAAGAGLGGILVRGGGGGRRRGGWEGRGGDCRREWMGGGGKRGRNGG